VHIADRMALQSKCIATGYTLQARIVLLHRNRLAYPPPQGGRASDTSVIDRPSPGTQWNMLAGAFS
jgi:hypothetical protein